MRRPPARRYRIIRGPNGGYRSTSFHSRDFRDIAAAKFADIDGETVICESWSPAHPQDHLNQGWACDKVVHPRPAVAP